MKSYQKINTVLALFNVTDRFSASVKEKRQHGAHVNILSALIPVTARNKYE